MMPWPPRKSDGASMLSELALDFGLDQGSIEAAIAPPALDLRSFSLPTLVPASPDDDWVPFLNTAPPTASSSSDQLNLLHNN